MTDVCKSDAVINKLPFSISKRTLSKIGTTGLEVITPFIAFKFFRRYDEETIKFILSIFLLLEHQI